MATGIKRFSDFTEKDANSLLSNSYIVGYDTVGSTNEEIRIGLEGFYQNPLNPLYTNLNANSGNWQSTYSSVASLSDGWGLNTTKIYVHTNFLPLSGGTVTGTLSANTFAANNTVSKNWADTYNTVHSNSASWVPTLDSAFNYGSISFALPGAQNNTNILTTGSSVVSSGRNNIILGNTSTIERGDRNTIINSISSSTIQNVSGTLVIGGSGVYVQASTNSSSINTISASILGSVNVNTIGTKNSDVDTCNSAFIIGGQENYIFNAENAILINAYNTSLQDTVSSGLMCATRDCESSFSQMPAIVNSIYSSIDASIRSAILNSTSAQIINGSFSTCYNCTSTFSTNDNNTTILGSRYTSSKNNNNTLINNTDFSIVHDNIDCGILNDTSSSLRESTKSYIFGGSGCNIFSCDFVGITNSSNSEIRNATYALIFGGRNNKTELSDTYILGTSLTANRVNTVFTNNIVNSNTLISNTLSANNNIILKAPNNNLYSVTVNNAGSLVTTPL